MGYLREQFVTTIPYPYMDIMYFPKSRNQETTRLLPEITESLRKNLAADPVFALIDFVPTSDELVEYKKLKEERNPRR